MNEQERETIANALQRASVAYRQEAEGLNERYTKIAPRPPIINSMIDRLLAQSNDAAVLAIRVDKGEL